VHRLDKDTTGVMVCAKTEAALTALAEQFRDKTKIAREYVAILDGALPAGDVFVESYLYRDPGSRVRFASMSGEEHARRAAAGTLPRARYAKSVFRADEVLAGCGARATLARVRLFTGRTHQIRVHARELKAPVLGDATYGRADGVSGAARQMLHARLLAFAHPASGERLRFEAPYPADFATVLEKRRGFRKSADAPIEP
jgi:RluA family pseudouridine synthase